MSDEVQNNYEDLTMEEEFYEFDINDPNLTPAQLDYITDMILKADVRAGNRIHHKNPILFKEHMRTRYRREIYPKSGVPDPSVESGMYNRCVDSETEALTNSGWKRYDEINKDKDLIWAYDIEQDGYRWSAINDMFIKEYEGMLQVLESQNISSRTTEGHSWAVVHESDKTNRFKTKNLSDRDYIVLARKPLNQSESLKALEVHELLGWVLTDGSYMEGNKACVYQSLNNPKMIQLQECLIKNGCNPIPHHVDNNNVGRWYIPAAVGKKIKAIAPTKLISSVDFTKLNYYQLEALLDGIVYGDGYLRKSKVNDSIHREIYTTKKDEADAIQMLCSLLGHTTRVKVVHNKKAFCPIEYIITIKVYNGNFAYVRNARQEDEYYKGDIWCPTTETGFWLARRNGKVYTTGNTHPEGRKVNSEHQRKINGASFYR
jgi:hypothetical protein